MVGPPKAGKSTLALMAARAAHSYGERPLFMGFEMSNEEQEERFDAINSQISHSRLRNGELKRSEWEKLERSIHSIANMQSFWFSSDSRSATTLTGMQGKVETLKPTFLVVDGVYMMDDEFGEAKGSPQALTNLTRGFKRMAQNLQIPIVITTQVLEWKLSKKRGITTDSIGYSSSFAQDSDVVLGVEKTDLPAVNKIKVVAARNCPPIETHVQWDWDTGSFVELETDQIGDADATSTW
jgi:replicative DNA helicase